MGDLDGDGVISIDDAYQALLAYSSISAGGTPNLTEAQKKFADVDKDGEITINDAFYILRYYAEHSAGNPEVKVTEWQQNPRKCLKCGLHCGRLILACP